MFFIMVSPAAFEQIRIVFHPRSGKGVAQRRALTLAQELRSLGVSSTLIDTNVYQGGRLEKVLTSADAVIVLGGDGLVHYVVQHLAGRTSLWGSFRQEAGTTPGGCLVQKARKRPCKTW